MDRPADRGTLASRPSTKSVPPPPAPPKSSLPPGLMPAALLELRGAAATFDYLRSTGDPTEFWETLRLARSRRSLAPQPGGEVSVPGADEEASIRQALDSVREKFSELVGELRYYLEGVTNLPEPAERFEMALAFLMASSRESEFVTLWLKEPDKHRSKASEKLRSLAAITDPYREAMKPWSLDGPTPETKA
ncbi:MAG TPA: hypothetical protein VF950_07810 [Planctomycetota bacterium]